MVNLFERLKPDYASVLEDERSNNPQKVENIEKTLREIFFVIEIPYGTILPLYWICYNAGLPFDMINAWEIFEDYK